MLFSGENSKSVRIICKNEVTVQCDNVTNLLIEGLTFTHHSSHNLSKNSSALEVHQSVRIVLRNSVFQGDGNFTGGVYYARAINSLYSSLHIENCHFEGNTGSDGGAIFALVTDLSLVDSTFVANKVHNNGGAIYARRSNLIVQGTSCANFSSREDTSCRETGTAFKSDFACFSGNKAQDGGGAVYLSDTRAWFSGTCIVFENNKAKNGGGIQAETGTELISKVHLFCANNSAEKNGGAINIVACYINLGNSVFAGNMALEGGAMILTQYLEESILSLDTILP